VKTTSFTVDSDSTPPTIVRAYHDDNYLRLVTNERAECVYDIVSCDYPFEDGIKMNVFDEVNHYTDWDLEKTFYVKCMDEYGNRLMSSNQCNIIVRPFELSYE